MEEEFDSPWECHFGKQMRTNPATSRKQKDGSARFRFFFAQVQSKNTMLRTESSAFSFAYYTNLMIVDLWHRKGLPFYNRFATLPDTLHDHLSKKSLHAAQISWDVFVSGKAILFPVFQLVIYPFAFVLREKRFF